MQFFLYNMLYIEHICLFVCLEMLNTKMGIYGQICAHKERTNINW